MLIRKEREEKNAGEERKRREDLQTLVLAGIFEKPILFHAFLFFNFKNNMYLSQFGKIRQGGKNGLFILVRYFFFGSKFL